MRTLIKLTLVLSIIATLLLSSLHIYVKTMTADRVYDSISVPWRQTALLLGASVMSDGTLTRIMRDRADTAIEIYKRGLISEILVSGDGRDESYDEVYAIVRYLMSQGVNLDDIDHDRGGVNTYDSIYRARHLFYAPPITIVSQGFHIPRALFIADHVSLDAIGVKADRGAYPAKNTIREFFANAKAIYDIWNVSPAYNTVDISDQGEFDIYVYIVDKIYQTTGIEFSIPSVDNSL